MSGSPNKLYLLLAGACMAGYIWLFVNMHSTAGIPGNNVDACFIKQTLHIPCPSCGSTRSVIALLHGDVAGGLYWNPLGILLLVILAVVPVWIVFDMVGKKYSLLKFYLAAEGVLRKKEFFMPLIVLVLLNWAWNIQKHL